MCSTRTVTNKNSNFYPEQFYLFILNIHLCDKTDKANQAFNKGQVFGKIPFGQNLYLALQKYYKIVGLQTT